MKYLVLGSGGREHAIAWRLKTDGSASEVYVSPGNGGIQEDFRVNIAQSDFNAIAGFCSEKAIDCVVVGPEAPLALGIVDFLQERGIPVFGPSKAAARLESSKIFAKQIMDECSVPSGEYKEFSGPEKLIEYINSDISFPLVIKLDGLAAGKGVIVAENREQALEFVKQNVKNESPVFVEEFFEGEEASVLGVSDGTVVVPFLAAQDHKRIFDGDRGPNTGGMGAYAPAPVLGKDRLKEVKDLVLQPVIDGMRKRGTPFKGILYAGIMVTSSGIKVLEFNVRFGDPETQALLPLLDCPLGDIITASVNGTLAETSMSFKNMHAITVVMSSGGYPGSYEKGKIIHGLENISEDVTVFHAGTEEKQGKIITNGGRVLNITAVGKNLYEARDRVYKEIDKISFEGSFYRKDIGYRALNR